MQRKLHSIITFYVKIRKFNQISKVQSFFFLINKTFLGKKKKKPKQKTTSQNQVSACFLSICPVKRFGVTVRREGCILVFSSLHECCAGALDSVSEIFKSPSNP